jgi:hypothetical protein
VISERDAARVKGTGAGASIELLEHDSVPRLKNICLRSLAPSIDRRAVRKF